MYNQECYLALTIVQVGSGVSSVMLDTLHSGCVRRAVSLAVELTWPRTLTANALLSTETVTDPPMGLPMGNLTNTSMNLMLMTSYTLTMNASLSMETVTDPPVELPIANTGVNQ